MKNGNSLKADAKASPLGIDPKTYGISLTLKQIGGLTNDIAENMLSPKVSRRCLCDLVKYWSAQEAVTRSEFANHRAHVAYQLTGMAVECMKQEISALS